MQLSGTAIPRYDLLGPVLVEGFSADQYIAHQLFKPLPVEKPKGAIPNFLLTNDQIINTKRTPRGGFNRQYSQTNEKTYNCTDDGIEEPLDHNDYAVLGEDRAQIAVGQRLVHTVLRAREKTLADALLSAAAEATFAGQVTTAANAWDAALGDPYTNIADARDAMVRRIGMGGNALFMSYGVYTKLKKNAKVQSNYRALVGLSGSGGSVSDAIALEIPASALAAIFDVKYVFISAAIFNQADSGQTPNRTFVWPTTYCGLAQISAGGGDANEVALGRMMTYELANDVGELATGSFDSSMALLMEQYRDETAASDILRCRDHIDMPILVPEAHQIIKSI